MDISLSPELEAFIRAKVAAGDYPNESALICDALALLKSNQELFEDDSETLRKEIAVGLDEADRGLSTAWNPDEVWAEVEKRQAANQPKPDKKVG